MRFCIVKGTGFLASACTALNIAGCAHTFDVTVPQSSLQAYLGCVKAPGGSCQKPQSKALVIQGQQAAAPDERPGSTSPLVTAPQPAFTNPFRASKPTEPPQARPAAQTAMIAQADAMAIWPRDVPSSASTLAAGVDGAVSVLSSPVQTQINHLRDGLSTSAQSAQEVQLDAGALKAYAQKVTTVTNMNGWSAYRSATIYNYITTSGVAATTEDVRRAIFIEAYVKAYFRNGEFGNVQFSAADLYKEFPDLNKLNAADKAQLDALVSTVQKAASFGKIGAAGFVTRTGTTYQISPIQVTVDPTKKAVVSVSKVDYVSIGADLIRVVLEAIFDAHDMLPAVSNATGVKANINVTVPPGFDGLQVFSPAQAGLTQQQFDQTCSISNAVEGGTTLAVSEIIRGIGPVALNNEAIAQLIETIIGVTARKVTEKAAWCWYSCGLDALTATSLQDIKKETEPNVAQPAKVRVTVTY